MSQTTGFDQALLEIYSELNRDRLMELVVRYARDRLDARREAPRKDAREGCEGLAQAVVVGG